MTALSPDDLEELATDFHKHAMRLLMSEGRVRDEVFRDLLNYATRCGELEAALREILEGKRAREDMKAIARQALTGGTDAPTD